jgi:hypothetical protein
MVYSACPLGLKRVTVLGGYGSEDVPVLVDASLSSKSRSALGIEWLHVNADLELMSSTAQD